MEYDLPHFSVTPSSYFLAAGRKEHLLNTYHIPGSVLCALPCFLIFTKSCGVDIVHIFTDEEGEARRLKFLV